MCEPTANPTYDCGEVQAASGSPSSEHCAVAEPEVNVKVKFALAEFVTEVGLAVIEADPEELPLLLDPDEVLVLVPVEVDVELLVDVVVAGG